MKRTLLMFFAVLLALFAFGVEAQIKTKFEHPVPTTTKPSPAPTKARSPADMRCAFGSTADMTKCTGIGR